MPLSRPGTAAATLKPTATVHDSNQVKDNVTDTIILQLRARYNVSLSKAVFIGLCAYLNIILIWGYEACATDLDRFVICYPAYEIELPHMHRQAASSERCEIPSYHEWLNQPQALQTCARIFDSSNAREHGPVLSEAVLRNIWQEHVFSFMWAMFSMQRIVADAIERDG